MKEKISRNGFSPLPFLLPPPLSFQDSFFSGGKRFQDPGKRKLASAEILAVKPVTAAELDRFLKPVFLFEIPRFKPGKTRARFKNDAGGFMRTHSKSRAEIHSLFQSGFRRPRQRPFKTKTAARPPFRKIRGIFQHGNRIQPGRMIVRIHL